MKEIKLTNSDLIAVVDDEDFERVSQYKWRCEKDHKHPAYFRVRGSVNSKEVYLHRFILELQKTTLVVDHIDRNTLNNQKSNLRLVTQRENLANSCRRNTDLEFIYIRKKVNKHTTSFSVESKLENFKTLTFNNYEDALLVRDKLMVEKFGVDCKYLKNPLNIILTSDYPTETLKGGQVFGKLVKGVPQPHKQLFNRPSEQELHKLVWSKSTAAIAKDFGCSDKCVEKWCKLNDIPKPPRGFWQQLQANKMLGQCCPLPV